MDITNDSGVKRVPGGSREGGLALPPRHRGPARAEDEVNDIDARLWHPWLRINRVLRVMLHTRWSAEVRVSS
jgi:hypothetical protein